MTKPSGRQVLRKAAALSLSTVMLLGGMPAPALAQMANGIEVVAQANVASGMWGTCKWELSDGGTLTVHPGQAPSQPKGADSPWIDYAGDITEVICTEENGKMVVLGESAENLFAEQYNVLEFDLAGLDSSNVRNFSGMFSGCTGLRKLDVSGFDTSNVTNMAFMFRGCAKVSSLDFSSFDTSKVTNMYGMFNGAGVTSLDLSGFDTSRVTSMTGMFYDAVRLRELNVSGWDTSKVQEGSYLFHGCASLIGLDLSGWNTAAMQDHEQMYDGCSSLQSVKVDSTYQIKDEGMFPDVTATTGSWWSLDKQEWLSKADIVSGRSGVADTYTIYADTDHGIGIADAKVTLGESSYTWTGAEVKPTVTVELDGMTLRHGIDYDVSYQDNVQVGEAQLTVTGKGAFKGTKTVPFTIAYNSIFIDVTEKTAHIEDVIWMADNDIAEGWLRTDGKREFRPYTGVARADMAAFLFRLAVKWGVAEENWTPTIEQSKAFADVQFTTPHSREIRWLASVGISEGWAKKDSKKFEFRPYALVARQDMAAFLFRLAKLAKRGGATDGWTAKASSKAMFSDVDGKVATNHHDEVWWLAETGVSEGWDMGNGTFEFRGLNAVARADMAAFLHRMDGLE